MKNKKKLLFIFVIFISIYLETNAEIQASIGKIGSAMTKAGKNVSGKLNKIKNYIQSQNGPDVQTVTSAIDKIGTSVSKVVGADDTVGIVSGTLDIISAVTSLIPVHGPIISTMFSLSSTIFSAVGGGTSNGVGEVVKKEIEKALKNFDDADLRARASATEVIYQNSQSYLDGFDNQLNFGRHEISALASSVPIYQGVEFINILVNKIQRYAKSTDITDAKRAIDYIRLYVRLQVLRSAVLWHMYSIVKASEHSEAHAEGIKNVINHLKIVAKKNLRFLGNPEYSQAVFFAVLYPSQLPDVAKFLNDTGVRFQNLGYLQNGYHRLSTEKWPELYMNMYNNVYGDMVAKSWKGDQAQFHFKIVNSSLDNLFYLRPRKWPSYYVYMRKSTYGYTRGWQGPPGPQGEWKFTKFNDGKYLISSKKWPKWFLYVTKMSPVTSWENLVRGWEGDPGIQGHWIII